MNNEEKIINMLENLTKGQAETNQRLTELETKVDKLETKVDKIEEGQQHIRTQQKENTDIIKALVHGNELIKAKIDGMELSIARVEGDIEEIKKNATVLESVTVRNWSDIVALKKAK